MKKISIILLTFITPFIILAGNGFFVTEIGDPEREVYRKFQIGDSLQSTLRYSETDSVEITNSDFSVVYVWSSSIDISKHLIPYLN